jgi:hypothetical protein
MDAPQDSERSNQQLHACMFLVLQANQPLANRIQNALAQAERTYGQTLSGPVALHLSNVSGRQPYDTPLLISAAAAADVNLGRRNFAGQSSLQTDTNSLPAHVARDPKVTALIESGQATAKLLNRSQAQLFAHLLQGVNSAQDLSNVPLTRRFARGADSNAVWTVERYFSVPKDQRSIVDDVLRTAESKQRFLNGINLSAAQRLARDHLVNQLPGEKERLGAWREFESA